MNHRRIADAAKEIERLGSALEWLREFGPQLSPRDKESFGMSFRVIMAAAHYGSHEAESQLSAAAKLLIKDIVEVAIKDAENTVELLETAIKEEAARG